ncbi:hypothetical protein D4765_03275 [Subtercola vilae]|uniref:Uncharacterized protein n=1 Tax=Subtercola vilae TaxID=2056433 RepID=A0A4T2C701_9MICO|nr:hypothetical protein D4765_03275 [Subtercola vilae]
MSEVFEHWLRAISAGVAVAFFAFFSDGVAIGGLDGFVTALRIPITIGIGFTVSLLVAELNFGLGSDNGNRAKVAILLATLIDAVLATVVLWPRNRWYHRV